MDMRPEEALSLAVDAGALSLALDTTPLGGAGLAEGALSATMLLEPLPDGVARKVLMSLSPVERVQAEGVCKG